MRSKGKSIGLALGIKKNTIDQFSNEDDPYLETLNYWLEHGSSVTWKTLLDVLGRFETKHTVDELTAKIVSVFGGGDQESVCCVLREGTVWCGVWRRQVLVSYDLCLCLCLPSFPSYLRSLSSCPTPQRPLETLRKTAQRGQHS